MSSLFPEFYDRALEQLISARKTARTTQQSFVGKCETGERRMDGAQLGSIAISEHKARASVKFRRPTKVFEDGIQKSDFKYRLSLDDIASRDGIPLIEDGKLIGAIGCSGGAGSQDEAACMVGAATINK